MAAKSPDIVIQDWSQGIAESPLTGFGDMRNVDIYSKPGTLQIGYLPSATGSTITSLVKWIKQDPVTGNKYALDASGNLYKCTSGNTWSAPAHAPSSTGAGQGLEVWKNYVFVARSGVVDVMKISDDTWSNSWFTLSGSDGTWEPILAGQDDILYIGNGKFIDSVSEKVGQTFAPGTSSTYTQSTAALTLPAGYSVKCLADYGVNLMIGTVFASTVSGYMQRADIFPWDRTSTTFRLPIKIQENGINQLFTFGSLLYISAGQYGTIYVYNGGIAQEFKRLKNIVYNSSGDFIDAYPGAITYHQDKILFGTAYALGGTSPQPTGVYGLRGDVLTFENQISTGNAGGTSGQLIIGAIYSSGNTFWVGWRDGNSYGIDQVVTNGSTHYTSYAAYADSPFFHVGEPDAKREFDKVLINLAQPLTTGQGVKLQYRTALNGTFVAATDTFDFATFAGLQSISLSFNSPISVENVQIRALLTTGASSTTTPLLQSVTLR